MEGKPVYLPRSCRRARSEPPTQPTPSHATISYGPSCRPPKVAMWCLADPIESLAERESVLLIPRRPGPLRFTGPVQNHVELVQRRAFVAPDHEKPLAVRRGRVVQVAGWVQEEGGPIKKSARRAEGTVRMEIDGDHCLARDVKQFLAVPRPLGLRTTFPGDRDPVGHSRIGLYVDLSSARLIGSVGDPATIRTLSSKPSNAELISAATTVLGLRYGALPSKFAASFVLPAPLYFATCGYGHSGRVMITRLFST